MAVDGLAQSFLDAVTSSSAQQIAGDAGQDLSAFQIACQASQEVLQHLVTHHYLHQTGGLADPQQQEAAARQRQEVLDTLMLKLDVAASSLHETLEDLAEQHPPRQHVPDPKEIIAYGHRLRLTTFAKMGTISLPPAPQPWQMAQSTLYRIGTQLAAKQAQETLVPAPIIVPAQPAEAVPAYGQGFTLQNGRTLAPADLNKAVPDAGVQERPVLPAPIIPAPAPGGIDLGLILNPDMEEVSYTDSDDDSDDDDF